MRLGKGCSVPDQQLLQPVASIDVHDGAAVYATLMSAFVLFCLLAASKVSSRDAATRYRGLERSPRAETAHSDAAAVPREDILTTDDE